MSFDEIVTDPTLRELRSHGSAAFPFQYYYDDMRCFAQRVIQWHWHDELEFVRVDAGPVDCLIGSERIRMEAGEGLFVNSGIIHRFEAAGEGRMPNILFAPAFVAGRDSLIYRKFVEPLLANAPAYVRLSAASAWQGRVLAEMERAFAAARARGAAMELEAHAAVCAMWVELHRGIGARPPAAGKNADALTRARLHSMLQFIYGHYAGRVTLDDIAAAAGVSRSEALRCFRAGVRATPVRYLIEYRLNRAAELLRFTGDSVSEIASAVGFESVGYFSRAFAAFFGVRPSAFRRRERDAAPARPDADKSGARRDIIYENEPEGR